MRCARPWSHGRGRAVDRLARAGGARRGRGVRRALARAAVCARSGGQRRPARGGRRPRRGATNRGAGATGEVHRRRARDRHRSRARPRGPDGADGRDARAALRALVQATRGGHRDPVRSRRGRRTRRRVQRAACRRDLRVRGARAPVRAARRGRDARRVQRRARSDARDHRQPHRFFGADARGRPVPRLSALLRLRRAHRPARVGLHQGDRRRARPRGAVPARISGGPRRGGRSNRGPARVLRAAPRGRRRGADPGRPRQSPRDRGAGGRVRAAVPSRSAVLRARASRRAVRAAARRRRRRGGALRAGRRGALAAAHYAARRVRGGRHGRAVRGGRARAAHRHRARRGDDRSDGALRSAPHRVRRRDRRAGRCSASGRSTTRCAIATPRAGPPARSRANCRPFSPIKKGIAR